jgi:hypothetical protein
VISNLPIAGTLSQKNHDQWRSWPGVLGFGPPASARVALVMIDANPLSLFFFGGGRAVTPPTYPAL